MIVGSADTIPAYATDPVSQVYRGAGLSAKWGRSLNHLETCHYVSKLDELYSTAS
jgi:hypothetical protein